MTLTEKLERSVRWSRAHKGDLDARLYGEDGKPVCIICGERIVRTHGGSLPKTCANCREIHRVGWELSRRKVEGDALFAVIERAAARLAAHPAKRGYTPYKMRVPMKVVGGWRGRPCMGGGYSQNSATALVPDWNAATAPCISAKGFGKLRKAKGGVK
jgi:hypothetical protein